MVCGEKTEDRANFCMNCGTEFPMQELGNGINIAANKNAVKRNMNIKGGNYKVSRNKVSGDQYNINGDYNTVKSDEYQLDNDFNLYEWAAKLLFKHFSKDDLVLGSKYSYVSAAITIILTLFYQFKYLPSQSSYPPDIHDMVFLILVFIFCGLFCIGYIIVHAIEYYDFTFCKTCNKAFSYQRLESTCVDHKGELIRSHTDINTRYHCPTCNDTKSRKTRIYMETQKD
jgi:hypothetical protein